MKDTLIILTEPIYQFNKKFFDNLRYSPESSSEEVDSDLIFLDFAKSVPEFNGFNQIEQSLKTNNFKNILFFLDDIRFDCIVKTGNPFDLSKHDDRSLRENKSVYYDNWQMFSDKLPIDTKFLLFDYNHEAIQAPIESWTKEWLEISNKHYCISQRLSSIEHERCLNKLLYLPLINCYYRYGFSNFDRLDYSNPSNPKYDFITYLGHHCKEDKRKGRFETIKTILDNDISTLKYKDDDSMDVGWNGYYDGGNGHYWNLVNSLTAKLQIIFENDDIEKNFTEGERFYLTEKTLKCFYYPHPYILLLHSTVIDELKKYGFKFSYGGDNHDYYKDLLLKVKKDINGWIKDNMNDFYHNQDNLYHMINSKKLPHHLFIDKITKT